MSIANQLVSQLVRCIATAPRYKISNCIVSTQNSQPARACARSQAPIEFEFELDFLSQLLAVQYSVLQRTPETRLYRCAAI